MGNVYGVDSEMPLATQYIPAADVTLTAGSEVLGISTVSAIAATTPGSYYPIIRGSLTFTMGGTASAVLVIAWRFHSGSDIGTYTVQPGLLVASAVIQIPVEFIGADSPSAWYPTGTIIEVTGKTTTTACTLNKVGSYMTVDLRRGLNTLP